MAPEVKNVAHYGRAKGSVEKKWRGQPRRRIHEAKNALWERHSRYAQVLGHYTHTGWPAGRSLSNNSIMTLLLILVMI